MSNQIVSLVIVSCLVLISFNFAYAAPTKEFWFEEEKSEIKTGDKNVVLTKEASKSSEEDLEQFFKDQQQLSGDKGNALANLQNVGQSNNNNSIISTLGQLPYGSQLQDLYQMYTILQSIGISPSMISELIMNSIRQQLGR